VVGEGPVELGDEVGSDAGLSHEDDGTAVVAEAAEVLALAFGEGHGRIGQ
jgi:hypothetical protein